MSEGGRADTLHMLQEPPIMPQSRGGHGLLEQHLGSYSNAMYLVSLPHGKSNLLEV